MRKRFGPYFALDAVVSGMYRPGVPVYMGFA